MCAIQVKHHKPRVGALHKVRERYDSRLFFFSLLVDGFCNQVLGCKASVSLCGHLFCQVFGLDKSNNTLNHEV